MTARAMTTPTPSLVEICARALCEADYPGKAEAMNLNSPNGLGWGLRTEDAQSTLSAIASAGFVIAPREPTAEMIEAGLTEQAKQLDAIAERAGVDADAIYSLAVGPIYRAMLRVATQGGEG